MSTPPYNNYPSERPPVGIISNASYTYGAVEKRHEVEFTGNRNILPPDGSLVVVKVKVQKSEF